MTQYLFDSSRSTIELSIRHLILERRVRFTNFAGVLVLDAEDLSSSTLTLELEAASIVGDGRYHIEQLFDVARSPLIRFASTRVEPVGHRLRVTGALTINGVTRPVVLHLEPLASLDGLDRPEHIGVLGSLSIDRRKFGLQLLSGGGLFLGDVIEIDLELRGARAEVRAAA